MCWISHPVNFEWLLMGYHCLHLPSVCDKGIKTISFASGVAIFHLSLKDLQKDLFIFIYLVVVLGMGASLEPLFLSTIASFASLFICSAFHSSYIHSLNLESFICLNPQSIYRYIISPVTQTFIRVGTILLCTKVTTMAYIWYIGDLKFKCSSMTGCLPQRQCWWLILHFQAFY